jgi:hypothetical protein
MCAMRLFAMRVTALRAVVHHHAPRAGRRTPLFRPRIQHVEHAEAEEVDDHRGEQRGDDPRRAGLEKISMRELR